MQQGWKISGVPHSTPPSVFPAARRLPAVVPAAFGIYSLAGNGAGPGRVRNYLADDNQPDNTITNPAVPGQTLILAGTGLGKIDDPAAVEVFAGNKPAQVFRANRPATP